MYGWEGGTKKVAYGGTHLKNALAEVPAIGATSKSKHSSTIQTTGLSVAGAVCPGPTSRPLGTGVRSEGGGFYLTRHVLTELATGSPHRQGIHIPSW